MRKYCFFTIAVFLVQSTIAGVIYVPGNYPSIQAGLNAAEIGDTVLVQPGNYFENLMWPEIHGIKLIAAEDSTNTVIDGNYSGAVIYFPSTFFYDTTTVVKNFTITHGSESGIFLQDADISIENIHITANIGAGYYDSRIGGGMICYYSSPVIKDSKIDNNSIEGYSVAGGGVYLSSYSSPSFINVEISGNICHSTYNASGGGIFFENHCNPYFNNVSISRNIIESEDCWGAGVYCHMSCNPIFEKSKIDYNEANGYSDNRGGGIYCSSLSTLYLSQCYIINNRFNGTASSNLGTGIFCINTQFTAINCLIASNTVSEDISDFDAVGLYAAFCEPASIINSTIAGNYRENYTMSSASGVKFVDSYVGLKNSIFWNENLLNEIYADIGTELAISYSNVNGGWAGAGNIEEDPLFADDSTFIIQLGSPCVNAGTNYAVPFVDILGNPRPMPMNTNPDMGAYEVDQPVSVRFIAEDSDISIFPNPVYTTAILHFKNPDNDIYEFQLFDNYGKLLKKIKNISGNKISFHRDDLPSGVYWGNLTGKGNKIYNVKIIIY